MSKEPITDDPFQGQSQDFREEVEEETIVQKPKVKRVLNEKQKEAVAINLAKGRAKRDENRKLKKEEDMKEAEKMVVKKAERILKTKTKKETQLKSLIGLDDNDEDQVEERIIKKPKKKKIIYREESDSEEEVIIKRLPKKIIDTPPVIPEIKKPEYSLRFI